MRNRPVAAGGIAAFLGLALVGLDGIALFSGAEPHGGFWNGVPLWDLGFGFLGAFLLFTGARRLVKPLLNRPEDYYRVSKDR